MTHRGLCRSRRHPAFAQQRAEGVPKGMNVNRSAPFVHLGDARKPQVPVKNIYQTSGTVNSGVSGNVGKLVNG